MKYFLFCSHLNIGKTIKTIFIQIILAQTGINEQLIFVVMNDLGLQFDHINQMITSSVIKFSGLYCICN